MNLLYSFLLGYKRDRDAVSGYTIRELEDALEDRTSWESWRENIKDKYKNDTEGNLWILFYYWDDTDRWE